MKAVCHHNILLYSCPEQSKREPHLLSCGCKMSYNTIFFMVYRAYGARKVLVRPFHVQDVQHQRDPIRKQPRTRSKADPHRCELKPNREQLKIQAEERGSQRPPHTSTRGLSRQQARASCLASNVSPGTQERGRTGRYPLGARARPRGRCGAAARCWSSRP